MKLTLLAIAALLLAGCHHLYGSMDAGRLAPATAPLGSR
jgi:hypothetical protein